jgi:hypothetical protein
MRWTRRRGESGAPAGNETIPFFAYATDSVVSGVIALELERLADLLTSVDAYPVRHAVVEPLGDGPLLELDDLVVVRDDICIVAGTGPRGNPARRIRTRPHRVFANVGPYEVRGYLHSVPAADAISLAQRRQIIPMTDCEVWYPRLGGFVGRAHPTLLVNRQHLLSLEDAEGNEVAAAQPTTADAETKAGTDPR